jgi:thiol-disulfide isomerase/thioredoxin
MSMRRATEIPLLALLISLTAASCSGDDTSTSSGTAASGDAVSGSAASGSTASGSTASGAAASGNAPAEPPAARSPLNAVDIDPLSIDQFAAVLESNRGQVLLINLWATWCAPCLEEIPDLLELEATLGPQGMQLIGISVDSPDAGDQVREFRDRWFPDFRTYHSVEADWYRLVALLETDWAGILPTSFIVDRSGAVVEVVSGGRDYDAFVTAVSPYL